MTQKFLKGQITPLDITDIEANIRRIASQLSSLALSRLEEGHDRDADFLLEACEALDRNMELVHSLPHRLPAAMKGAAR